MNCYVQYYTLDTNCLSVHTQNIIIIIIIIHEFHREASLETKLQSRSM